MQPADYVIILLVVFLSLCLCKNQRPKNCEAAALDTLTLQAFYGQQG
jgi:hypothetical protein